MTSDVPWQARRQLPVCSRKQSERGIGIPGKPVAAGIKPKKKIRSRRFPAHWGC